MKDIVSIRIAKKYMWCVFAVWAVPKQPQRSWIQRQQPRRSSSGSSSSSKFSATVGVLHLMSSSLPRPSISWETCNSCYPTASVAAATFIASPTGGFLSSSKVLCEAGAVSKSSLKSNLS